jgi:O-antigen/teichoic acid export membrane protein
MNAAARESSNALKRIALGSAFFSFGAFGANVAQFFIGIIIIRAIDQQEYGLLSLGTIIVSLLVTLAVLGLYSGVPRTLARCRQQGPAATGAVAGSALFLTLLTAGLLTGLVLWQSAAAARFFNKPGLTPVLTVLALLIPPLALLRVLTAVFRGLENIRPKVVFQDFTLYLSRLLFLLPVVAWGLGVQGVAWVYVASAWLACAGCVLYAGRGAFRGMGVRVDWPVSRELIFFSLPLLGVGIMDNLMGWTGTLALGYFQQSAQVALYSAPFRLAVFIPFPLGAVVYLYLPIATRLLKDGAGAGTKFRELYVSTTKWAFFFSLPLILWLAVDAEFVVTTLFGAEYRASAGVLRILVLGFSCHAFLGPNGTALTAAGNTRAVFRSSLLAGATVILLSVILVPRYSAAGAAAAMAASRLVSNGFLSYALYRSTGTHPFRAPYLTPVAAALAGGLLLLAGAGGIAEAPLFAHLLAFVACGLIVVAAFFLTRSLTGTDLEVLGSIERRLTGAEWVTGRLSPRRREGRGS